MEHVRFRLRNRPVPKPVPMPAVEHIEPPGSASGRSEPSQGQAPESLGSEAVGPDDSAEQIPGDTDTGSSGSDESPGSASDIGVSDRDSNAADAVNTFDFNAMD